jgi:ERCC4-type nuclease
VDDREGSRQLAAHLLKAGLPVEVTRLEAGDVWFVGRGERGVPINIVVEHKTVNDLVASLRTGRLQGHQLLKMREGADHPIFDFCWLVVEGELVYSARGVLMRRQSRRQFTPVVGHMTIAELYKRLLVLHLRGGLPSVLTRSRRDTVRWIEALYRVFTDKDLDAHRSHLGAYTPPGLVAPSQFCHTMGTLPGIGLKVAHAAERQFQSIRAAVNASPVEWAALETVDQKTGQSRRFGERHAQALEDTLSRKGR